MIKSVGVADGRNHQQISNAIGEYELQIFMHHLCIINYQMVSLWYNITFVNLTVYKLMVILNI